MDDQSSVVRVDVLGAALVYEYRVRSAFHDFVHCFLHVLQSLNGAECDAVVHCDDEGFRVVSYESS